MDTEKLPLYSKRDGKSLKILVIQQKMIGDVLISTIICEALRYKYPDAAIDYIVNSNTVPVIENNPFIDSVITFENTYSQSKTEFFQFLKTIRKANYHVVIDAYGKWESNFITLFSGAEYKMSFYKWYTFFIYSKTIKKRTTPLYDHSIAIENRLRLVFDEDQIAANLTTPKIFLTDIEKRKARLLLEENHIDVSRPLMMISVLGSTQEKTYPAQYMANLLDYIVVEKPKTQLLFNYIPSQNTKAKEIYDLTKEKTQNAIFFDVYGKSLREFLAITYHCHALIGNEGGATNMAKAMQVPTFIIFSPYLNKSNWYGSSEQNIHEAVHLSDFVPYTGGDAEKAKKNPEVFYQKFKPTFIHSKLKDFLNRI